MKKRVLAFILALALLATICPAVSLPAFAEEDTGKEIDHIEVEDFQLLYLFDGDWVDGYYDEDGNWIEEPYFSYAAYPDYVTVFYQDGTSEKQTLFDVFDVFSPDFPTIDNRGWGLGKHDVVLDFGWITLQYTVEIVEAIGGSCGEALTWAFDAETRTLTIAGTGDMDDFEEGEEKPWYRYEYLIRAVEFQDGLTSIGTYAFSSMNLSTIDVPAGVKRIGDYAFDCCNSLSSVTFHEGLISIGESAFAASSLTALELPEGLTELGAYAFAYTYNLSSLELPEGLRVIGDSAFEDCGIEALTLPASLTTIGDSAFAYGCFPTVKIPSGVIHIGDGAFACCDLTEINVSPENPAYSSENGVLFNLDKTELLQYPCLREGAYEIPDGVRRIAEAAFTYASSMSTVTIPSSVEYLGAAPFGACINLESITVSPANAMYYSDECGVLFNKDCTELIKYPTGRTETSYDVPEGVKTIDERAFMRCTLQSVTVPDSIKRIGEAAFAWCLDLTNVTLPYWCEMTRIEQSTFSLCSSLKTVNIPSSVTFIGEGAFSRCSSLEHIRFRGGIQQICDSTFCDCSALKSIVIPDGVTSIGTWAFENCTSLTDVTIPDTVTSIGYGAFSGCDSLKSLLLPASVTTIEEFAFGLCYDEDYMVDVVPGFILFGHENTAAQDYAELRDIPFVSVDRLSSVAERMLADGLGTGYSYNTVYTEEMYNDYCGWVDEQWAFTNQCIYDYVHTNYTDDAYASFIGRETYAEIAANEGLKVAYAMRLWGFCKMDEVGGKEVLVDYATGTYSWDLETSFPTMDDFLAITKLSYNNDPVDFFKIEATGWEGVSVTDYALKKLCETYAARAFYDVPTDAYFFAPVNWAVAQDPKITSGMDEIRFAPNNDCTREQIVTFLWAANGKPEPAGTGEAFNDVASDAWYYKPVMWAVEQGITSGMGNGCFGVGQSCTRAQAMTFLWAANNKPAPESAENPFTDVTEGDWFCNAILWAAENGVTAGIGDGLFGVNNTCTRAQIVTFLWAAEGRP
jgi:hypothetical protein